MSRIRMHTGLFLARAVPAIAVGGALIFGAAPAFAKGPKAKDNKRSACTAASAAYDSAVEHEQSGHLREASILLSECTEAKACGVLATRCKALADKLSAETPTVVPMCSDEKGQPKVDVEVKVDGDVLTSQLDGRALPLEVGLHEFTFASDGKEMATEKVMILEGQRNRPLTVRLNASGAATLDTGDRKDAVADTSDDEPVAKPAHGSGGNDATGAVPEAPSHPRSAVPFFVGGAGLVAVAAGGLLTYWGSQDNSDLQKMCKPNCSPGSVNHIQTMYIAADISFGVGAAALGLATWLFARSPSAEKPATSTAAVLEVHPTSSGAFASVSKAF